MAATPAVRVLEKARVAHTLHPYDPGHSPDQGYGEAAVAALGSDPRQVFKTLVADVDGKLTVAVVPVAGTLDLKALAAATGGRKAVMADPAHAERTTGYVRGGISPLGQKKLLPTVVDDSALEFVRAELATLRAVFPHVALLARIPVLAGEDGGNVVAVASRSPIPAAEIAEHLTDRELVWQVAQGEELARFVGDAPVLTDDFAPVDQLLTPYG